MKPSEVAKWLDKTGFYRLDGRLPIKCKAVSCQKKATWAWEDRGAIYEGLMFLCDQHADYYYLDLRDGLKGKK